MKLGFEEAQTSYTSGSQGARSWTERWVGEQVFCPNCGNPKITQFKANRPVADFLCTSCSEEYELKSQKSNFGNKVLDGAFRTMCERLAESNNPNLFLLKYDLKRFEVASLFVVPKQFFVREIIQEKNGSRRQHVGPGGLAAIFCCIRFQQPEKSSSFEMDSHNRRNWCSRNGRKHFSYEKKDWRRKAG